MDKIIKSMEEDLLTQGVISKANFFGDEKIFVDYEKIYAIDIELFLEEIIENFQVKASEFHQALMYSGVSIHVGESQKPYMYRNTSIDLKYILKSAGNKNWFDVIKGFLNTWEFLFLFSITESTLKNIIKNKDIHTRGLIVEINKKHSGICRQIKDNYNISEKLSIDIWNIFVSIRNVYAHTHGIISDANKKDIIKRSNEFKQSYSEYTKPFLSHAKDADEFFLKENMKTGNFYFLADYELNIFRNFISDYIFVISDFIKD